MEPTTALTKSEEYKLLPEDIKTLVDSNIIPKDTPEGTIRLFGKFCAESRLSPFKRQVHLIGRKTKDGMKYSIQTGIDGYRSIADRTGRYAGSDDYRFNDTLTEYQHIITEKGRPPVTATATVYKIVSGMRVPFTATARWEEYAQTKFDGSLNPIWSKMPYLMIGKCAEALALRKAFPDELGGIYTDEEMAQAEVVEVPPSVGAAEAKRGDAGVETRAVQTGQATPAESSVDAAIRNELGGERVEHPVKEPDKKHPTKGDWMKLEAERKKRSIASEVVQMWLKNRYQVATGAALTMEQYDELRNRIIPGLDKGTILPVDITVWPNPLANEERSAA